MSFFVEYTPDEAERKRMAEREIPEKSFEGGITYRKRGPVNPYTYRWLEPYNTREAAERAIQEATGPAYYHMYAVVEVKD